MPIRGSYFTLSSYQSWTLSMCAYVCTYVCTRIGTSDDCGHSCIPFTQYSPLATETLQSVVSCCLTSLQDIALSGDNLMKYY